MSNINQVKKGVITKRVQYNKGKLILSKSKYNGISTYTESYYYSIKSIVIALLFIVAFITSHLSII